MYFFQSLHNRLLAYTTRAITTLYAYIGLLWFSLSLLFFYRQKHCELDMKVHIFASTLIGFILFLLYRYHVHGAQRKELKQRLLRSNGFIAHELRTPLTTIQLYMQGIETCLPELIAGYQYAQRKDSKQFTVANERITLLQKAIDDIVVETKSAFNLIDSVLIKSNQTSKINRKLFKPCSVKQTIGLALQRYPMSQTQKQLIVWQPDRFNDFRYYGQEDMTIHILFNLLRNALYQITKTKKGAITISLSQSKNYNVIEFRDTGPGVAKKNLTKIFQHDYSVSENGIGLGLHFCRTVMQHYHGKIKCNSLLNEWTEFKLYFPKKFSAED